MEHCVEPHVSFTRDQTSYTYRIFDKTFLVRSVEIVLESDGRYDRNDFFDSAIYELRNDESQVLPNLTLLLAPSSCFLVLQLGLRIQVLDENLSQVIEGQLFSDQGQWYTKNGCLVLEEKELVHILPLYRGGRVISMPRSKLTSSSMIIVDLLNMRFLFEFSKEDQKIRLDSLENGCSTEFDHIEDYSILSLKQLSPLHRYCSVTSSDSFTISYCEEPFINGILFATEDSVYYNDVKLESGLAREIAANKALEYSNQPYQVFEKTNSVGSTQQVCEETECSVDLMMDEGAVDEEKMTCQTCYSLPCKSYCVLGRIERSGFNHDLRSQLSHPYACIKLCYEVVCGTLLGLISAIHDVPPDDLLEADLYNLRLLKRLDIRFPQGLLHVDSQRLTSFPKSSLIAIAQVANQLGYLVTNGYLQLVQSASSSFGSAPKKQSVVEKLMARKLEESDLDGASWYRSLLPAMLDEAYYTEIELDARPIYSKQAHWGSYGSGNLAVLWFDYVRGAQCVTARNVRGNKIFAGEHWLRLMKEFNNKFSFGRDAEALGTPPEDLDKLFYSSNATDKQIAAVLWYDMRKVFWLSGVLSRINVSECLGEVLDDILDAIRRPATINELASYKIRFMGLTDQTVYNCIDLVSKHSNSNSWYHQYRARANTMPCNLVVNTLLGALGRAQRPADEEYELLEFLLECKYRSLDEAGLTKYEPGTLMHKFEVLNSYSPFACCEGFLLQFIATSLSKISLKSSGLRNGLLAFKRFIGVRILQELIILLTPCNTAYCGNYMAEMMGRLPDTCDDFFAEDLFWCRRVFGYSYRLVQVNSLLLACGLLQLRDAFLANALLKIYQNPDCVRELIQCVQDQEQTISSNATFALGSAHKPTITIELGLVFGIVGGRYYNLISPQVPVFCTDLLDYSYLEFIKTLLINFMLLEDSREDFDVWLVGIFKLLPHELRFCNHRDTYDLIGPALEFSYDSNSLCEDQPEYQLIALCVACFVRAIWRAGQEDTKLIATMHKLLYITESRRSSVGMITSGKTESSFDLFYQLTKRALRKDPSCCELSGLNRVTQRISGSAFAWSKRLLYLALGLALLGTNDQISLELVETEIDNLLAQTELTDVKHAKTEYALGSISSQILRSLYYARLAISRSALSTFSCGEHVKLELLMVYLMSVLVDSNEIGGNLLLPLEQALFNTHNVNKFYKYTQESVMLTLYELDPANIGLDTVVNDLRMSPVSFDSANQDLSSHGSHLENLISKLGYPIRVYSKESLCETVVNSDSSRLIVLDTS